jgi:hypothetical protein
MSPSDMIISSFALRQLKPDAEANAVQNCSHQEACGLRRPSSAARGCQNMKI